MRRALDYGHLPAPAVPLAFLLAAPWFGAAAGLLAAWHGGAVFASRWNPAALAVVHLVTLGFLTMTMAGALLQMPPAVAGLPLRGARRAAAAFLSGRAPLFALAAVPLAPAAGLPLAAASGRLGVDLAAPVLRNRRALTT